MKTEKHRATEIWREKDEEREREREEREGSSEKMINIR